MKYLGYYLGALIVLIVLAISSCKTMRTRVELDFEPDQTLPDFTLEIDFSDTCTHGIIVGPTDNKNNSIEDIVIEDNIDSGVYLKLDLINTPVVRGT